MKKVFTSIWFLALIVALPIIIFMPPVFDKYTAEFLSIETKANSKGISYFVDLENDGEKERLEVFEANENLLSFQVFDQNNALYNQYNFPHFFNLRLNNIYFFDLDSDSLKEVYGFTVFKDSVFLSYVEPFDPNHTFQSYFVTTVDRERRKNLDISTREIALFDFDGDSDKELVFSLAVGYNWFPRKIFVFHPETGVVESSEEFGVHFSSLTPFDYNSDGEMELICISSSADNIDIGTDVKYHDDRPRLFIINKDLKESISPVEFPKGIGSRLHYEILDETSGELLICYINFTSGNELRYITKIYPDGTPSTNDTLFLDTTFGKRARVYSENDNRFFVISERGKILHFDNNLNVLDSMDLAYKADHMILGKFDIIEDGNPEFCATSDSKVLHIYFENFKYDIEIEYEDGNYGGVFVKSPRKNEILIDAAGKLTVYKIALNPFFYLKYPGFLIIYLLTVGFVWLLQLARIKQLKEKFELQQKVKELQFISLKNQLDPHFIFNTFNTIASTIKQGKNDEAYELMIRFSKLVRINLEDSDGIYTTLKKELKFVDDYLTIQQIRFKELFAYKITIEKSVNMEIDVPKLLVQIHVENALKHGVRPLRRGGKIDVKVSNEFAFLKIVIIDNGIGRKQSKLEQTESNGVGLKAIKQIIELNNQNQKHKIAQEIIDLTDDEGSPIGTKVILRISD